MRKHGGEKGVPFRVQIDTFKENDAGEYTEHLHSASCQIKVFKVGRDLLILAQCLYCMLILDVFASTSFVCSLANKTVFGTMMVIVCVML